MQRYGDLTVFKMAAVRHLGFVKFDFLIIYAVKGHILHELTKFHKDRSNRYGDIVIFVIVMDVSSGRPMGASVARLVILVGGARSRSWN